MCVKVYAVKVEVEVEVEWMVDVFTKNPMLSVE